MRVGNQTSGGADTFAWDVEDRMTSATVGGTAKTFAYNGDGLRNSRTAGGSTTTFTWDVARSIAQVLDDGAFKYPSTGSGQANGLERIAEVGPGTTTHYYLPDGLGSTMALVDATGALVNTYNYDVFGAVRSSTGTQANEFQFTGEQVDSGTGLQYLRARFYDMATGRFINRDSFQGTVWSPISQNLFTYAHNNPVLLVDSSGHVAGQVTPRSKEGSDYHTGPDCDEPGVYVDPDTGACVPTTLGGKLQQQRAEFGKKISRQLGKRGWTKDSVVDTIRNPAHTSPAFDRALKQPATAYYAKDGSYEVVNNVTHQVVQISDKNDSNWIPDRSITDPWRP